MQEKWNFMNPTWDGGKGPETWENSAESRMLAALLEHRNYRPYKGHAQK
jgi:hypothetical protein